MRPSRYTDLLSKALYTLLLYIVTNCNLWLSMPAAAHDIRLDGTRLSAIDGLSCNTVNDITQDQEGFIWLATSNGISRYDGYQFINFTQPRDNTRNKNNSSVAQLINDEKNGLIWGYSSNSILCCYDLEGSHFSEYFDSKEPTLLRNRFKSSHGIWLFSPDFGVRYLTYSKGKFHAIDYTVKNGKLASDRQLQIAEDGKQNIWIASDKGLNMVTPDHKSHLKINHKAIITLTCEGNTIAALTKGGEAYLYNSQGKLIKKSQLPSMVGFVGKSRASFFWQGEWYIFTEQETFAMNLKTGSFRKPKIQIPNAMDKNPLKSYHFLYDKKGNAYLFSRKGKSYKKFHLLDDKACINGRDKNFTATEDAHGRVYIVSYGNGLFVYDPKDDHLQHFSAYDKNPLIHSNFLLNVFIDQSGCLWLCMGDGVYCCREMRNLYTECVKLEPNDNREWSNYVRHISYIGNDQIAVSTRANKTYIYNIKTQKSALSLQTNSCVYTYAIDPLGKTWIGTKGDGIYINGIRYSKYEKEHFAPSANFYDVIFDKLGRAWVATWGDGLLLTQQKVNAQGNRTFKTFLAKNGKEAQIHDLLMDKKGRLWICTNNGIVMVDTRARNISEKSFIRFSEEKGTLPISEVDCGLLSHDGTLWFATTKGVLKCRFDEKARKLSFKQFDTTNGLTDNNTRSLAEDKFGNIWIGTEEGISRLNAKTNDIRSFQLGRDIQSNNFTENCAVQLPDGRIALGVANGMFFITPRRDTSIPNSRMKVAITDLTINGISIYDEEHNNMLTKSLSYAKEISLPSDKNSLCIYFSNFDYPHIKNAMYQYYLEGLDKDWRPATSINHADFSDLSPGHYTLHVRTRTGSNQWSKETTLGIHIRQPWYNTWMAWTVYLLLVGGAIIIYYRSWRRNFELNQQVEMEKKMSNFRIEFFTHISHEFRTPLSIIQSSIEKIMLSDEATGINKRTVLTLSRGNKRMQRLINQLMEFRKANTGNMKLNIEHSDIATFVRNIYNDIYTVAKQKDISMSFTPSARKMQLAFDRQKVENITYNLLSNAVKYTPDKGTIMVKLCCEAGWVKLTVEDNGPGIKPEREQDLFKPFMHGYVSKGGMGIGLYTAHEMAVLHKGSLSYQRSKALGGSLFTLTLPADESVYSPNDFADKSAVDSSSIEHQELENIVKEMTPQAINNVTVMVIEDDPDMMEQIKGELSVYFKVASFMNGKTGYENIKKVKPALLITDIMLPEMSGYEIASNLKADPETQNIPVIMLTAFDDVNHMLKAYKNFVDDYMVKPCNFKLLIARALQFVSMEQKSMELKEKELKDKESSIESVDNIQIKPVKEIKKTEPNILMSTLDKKFKDKLEAVVAQHVSDNNFNVDRLAELLNIGRTTMYNRTKAIMGVSPNIYIQNERLRIAAKMLLEGEYTVSEISDKVGFSDATYFYKCFKNKYGITPSKYGK